MQATERETRLQNQQEWPDNYEPCKCTWLSVIPGHQDDPCIYCAGTRKVTKGTVTYGWMGKS